MTAPAVTETIERAGCYVVEPFSPNVCNEQVTIESAQVLLAGQIIARKRIGAGRVASAFTGTGNGTMTTLKGGGKTQRGAYLIAMKTPAANGGVFSVTAPDGTVLDDATVGTPYVSDHLSFLLNDGSTDFGSDALFTVTGGTTVPASQGTGNQVISAVSLGPEAKPGVYTFIATAAGTNAATWELFDPDGESLGEKAYSGSGATAVFATPQINATITDGSTDAAVNDKFEVVAFNELTGGKVVAWNPNGVDGSEDVAGISWDNYDATAGDVRGVITNRDATVNKGELKVATGTSAGEKITAYAQLLANCDVKAIDSAW